MEFDNSITSIKIDHLTLQNEVSSLINEYKFLRKRKLKTNPNIKFRHCTERHQGNTNGSVNKSLLWRQNEAYERHYLNIRRETSTEIVEIEIYKSLGTEPPTEINISIQTLPVGIKTYYENYKFASITGRELINGLPLTLTKPHG